MGFIDFQAQPLWLNLAVFVAAGVIVWIGGVRLTRTLDTLATKTGLDEAFVGMLLLGGITSLPEVANVTAASAGGVPQLAVNNLLGSAAINILLLAIADAIVGREAVTSVIAQPATMMMCTLCMLVLGAVAVAATTGDVAAFGVGLWSIAICAMSVGFFALAAGYGARAQWAVKEDGAGETPGEADARADIPLRRLVGTTVLAGAAIFAAGWTLSETGEAIAGQTGLGTGMVGFVLIGIATSMPELSSITTSLRIGRYEMAFGQALGTNFVNLSLFLLADAVYTGGPVVNELGRFEAVSALLGLTLIGVFQVGLLERRNPAVLRMGYDSLAVMVLFAGGVGLLYVVR